MISRIFFALAALTAAWAAAALPAPVKVGDSWTYEARNGYNGLHTGTYQWRVTDVTDKSIGARVTDIEAKTALDEHFTLNWNPLVADWAALRTYEFTPAYPEFPDRIEPGVDWTQFVLARDPVTGQQMKMKVIGKVLGHERVRVPAGEFDCVKIERDTILDDAQFWRGPTRVWETEWYSPELKRSIKYETRSEYHEEGGRNSLRRGDWTIFELTAYKN